METKRKTGPFRKILVSICALALVACILLTLVFALNLQHMLPLIGSAPAPYQSEDRMRAITIKSDGGGVTPEELDVYFEESIQRAQEYGINTIIYEAKKDLSVFWRDSIFPTDSRLYSQDSLFEKVDPLSMLCAKLSGTGIELWLQIDAYNTSGYAEWQNGQAANLLKKLGGQAITSVAPDNDEYSKLLVTSISRLPHKYPVAGILLSGLDVGAGDGSGVYGVKFVEMLASIDSFWQKKGFKTQLAISFDANISENALVTKEIVSSLLTSGTVDYILPGITNGEGYVDRLQSWSEGGKFLFSQKDVISQSDLFAASLQQNCGGAILLPFGSGEADTLENDAANTALLPLYVNMFGASPTKGLPEAFEIPKTLGINYPVDGAKIYTTNVFVMGTSDPTLPLLCNDSEVLVRAANGSFGFLVDIVEGENVFIFTQEGQSKTITLNKPKPSAPSGGGETPEYPWDGTKKAEEGQTIRVTKTIAGFVSDYTNIDTISGTMRNSATAIVTESEQRVFRGNKTWFYKLTSGDYVWAQDCEWVEDAPNIFTGLSSEVDDGGELIRFTGSGTPALYAGNDSAKLTLTMYDTDFELGGEFSSELVKSAKLEKGENSVTLTLELGNVWGFSTEYLDGGTAIYLKKAPVQGGDPLRPLAGLRVMLDPGHGGKDVGAAGIMGENTFPNEKDINLALAHTIRYRLEQMGAEVIMTRTEDVFLELTEILELQYANRPDIFISVHHDSLEPDADLNDKNGSTAYYYNSGSMPNAPALANFLADNISQETGRQNRGANFKSFYVARGTICPSVLFEFGFVVNPVEFEDVTSQEGMYAAACGTASAVLAMFVQYGGT